MNGKANKKPRLRFKSKSKGEKTTYKVRCAVTFASYWFVEATSAGEAERIARRNFRKCDPEAEAAHINDSYEVEEAI